MRLLIVSQTNVPWTPPYSRFFVERGDAVLVVSASPEPIDGVQTEFIGVEPFDKFKHKHIFLTRVPSLRRIIRRFQPDLVFAPYIVSNGLLAALSWSGPLVVSARGGDVLDQAGQHGWRQRARDVIVRYVCKRADVVHAVSNNLETALLDLAVPRDKLRMIPLGVDVNRFTPAAIPAGTNLICTRKHEEIYDNPTIVRAMEILKNKGLTPSLTFVGGGHLIDERKRQVREAGLETRVQFAGHAGHDELPDLLRQAGIYISASLSDGTSSALLEAMACGLFPVVTRIAANTPWVDDEKTGLLFDPSDAGQLATAIERAIGDEALRTEARLINRQRVEQDGNLHRNNEALAAMFEKLLR